MRTVVVAIASGLGLGFVPKAPGTAGTLLGIPWFIAMAGQPWWLYLVSLAALVALSSWAASAAAAIWQEEDCQKIVVDEVAGYATTMFLAPLAWQYVLAGFVYFRVFDIVKPWPASYFDRHSHSGFGVTMDDVAAGVYACGAMHLTAYLCAVAGLPWV
jgi:phosphatidylglycerophosphatase A